MPVRKLVLFALLGASDFFLTWHLLGSGGGAVYESNPVAAWWLGHFGWLGLAGFKAATMLLAAALGVVVCLRRPAAGHRLLAFGCVALSAVVLYSGYLCHDLRRRPAGLDPDDASQLQAARERIDAGLRRARVYRTALTAAAEDVRVGRCTLQDAVTRLSATEQAHDAAWLHRFQIYYPGCGEREAIALTVVNHLHRQMDDTPAGVALRLDLGAQYKSLYGHAPPSAVSAGLARRNAGPV